MKIRFLDPLRVALPALLAFAAPAFAEELPFTVVHTDVSPGYVRERLPDGAWKTETYALGEGGYCPGEGKDPSIDPVGFREIAKAIAGPLAQAGYVSGRAAADTYLLIMVYWGKTIPYSDRTTGATWQTYLGAVNAADFGASMAKSVPAVYMTMAEPILKLVGDTQSEDSQLLLMQSLSDAGRARANSYNALLLGYAPRLAELANVEGPGPLQLLRRDLTDELEAERYFVVLQAFDFQKLKNEKQRRLLWVTRFSIEARGSRFDRALPAMARLAGQCFGQKTPTLVRTRHIGTVEVGEPTVIEAQPAK